jgi:LCP family protein required for cell wall assembly
LVVAVAVAVTMGYTALRLWLAWGSVERVEFAPEEARVALDSPSNPYLGSTTTIVDEEPEESDLSEEELAELETIDEEEDVAMADVFTIDQAIDAYLVLGSDRRPNRLSQRADVIMLLILPKDGTAPMLTSLPRDLWLRNPCTGKNTRINATLNGCGDVANGPETVALAVGDFTGIAVDHFIVFDFDGFRAVVDRVGGVEICTEYAVKDGNTTPVPLNLPAGCTMADGWQALAWVRSRKTLGYIDGAWRAIGTNDLTRNKRQQELLLQAIGRLGDYSDISELTALVEELSGSFIIDEGLSLTEAVSTAWSLRSLDLESIIQVELPVKNFLTSGGAAVLVTQASFQEVAVEANPDLALLFLCAPKCPEEG